MKKLILALAVLMISVNAYALELNYTLTDEYANRVVAMLKVYENNVWFEIAKQNPTWTDYQIAKEVIKKIITRNVRRFEAQVAGQQAAQSVQEDTGGMQ